MKILSVLVFVLVLSSAPAPAPVWAKTPVQADLQARVDAWGPVFGLASEEVYVVGPSAEHWRMSWVSGGRNVFAIRSWNGWWGVAVTAYPTRPVATVVDLVLRWREPDGFEYDRVTDVEVCHELAHIAFRDVPTHQRVDLPRLWAETRANLRAVWALTVVKPWAWVDLDNVRSLADSQGSYLRGFIRWNSP